MKRTGWESRSAIVLKKVISLFFCRGSALNFPSAARRITEQHSYERRHVKCDLAPNQKGPSYSQLLHEAWDAWPLPFFLFCFLSSSLIFLSAPWCKKDKPQILSTVNVVPCNARSYSNTHIRKAEIETGHPITDKSAWIVGNMPPLDGSPMPKTQAGTSSIPPWLETARGTGLDEMGWMAQAVGSLHGAVATTSCAQDILSPAPLQWTEHSDQIPCVCTDVKHLLDCCHLGSCLC